jgi:hypothetical protein
VLLAWRTDFACCCAVVHVLCAVCWADSARSVVAATIYCNVLAYGERKSLPTCTSKLHTAGSLGRMFYLLLVSQLSGAYMY